MVEKSKLLFSRYLGQKTREPDTVLFHKLHPKPLYLSISTWNDFLTNPNNYPKIFTALRQRHLLIDSISEDDVELSEARQKLNAKLDQPTILYLMMAQHCNLACSICPIPALTLHYGETLLSEVDAKAGVDLWIASVNEQSIDDTERYIIFYGGEPLLNQKTISKIVPYIQHALVANGLSRKNIHLMLATNGVLINDKVIELCHDNDISIAVGVDSFSLQDVGKKVYLQSGACLENVIEAVQSVVARGVTVYLSITITPDNISTLQEYWKFCRFLGISKFGFNFLKGRALLNYPGVDAESFYRQAAQAVIQSSTIERQADFEYQMEKKFTAFYSGDFFPVDCTCYGNQLVIQPNGQITNCPFYRNDLGHIREVGKHFRINKIDTVQDWRKRMPLYNAEFDDCDAISLCGGGCAWSSIQLNGDYMELDVAAKVFAEEALDHLIWSKLKKE